MTRPFAGIEKEDVGGALYPYLRPGNIKRDLSLPKDRNILSQEPRTYLLRVDVNEYKSARSGRGYFLATFTVVACKNATPGDGTNAPGSIAVWQCMMGDAFKRDTKTYICTAMNFDPGAFTEAMAEAVVSRHQPLTAARRYVEASVDNIKTKKEQKDFTPHIWKPLEAAYAADGITLTGLNPPARDLVAEYIATKGEIK